MLEEFLQALHVGGQAGDDATRRLVREVVEVEGVQVCEQPAAQVGEVTLTELSHPSQLDVRARDHARDEHEPDRDAPRDRAGRLGDRRRR